MSLEHLIRKEPHDGAVRGLEHLIALENLNGQLKAFLISCRVEGLSTKTITDYQQKIGVFTRFLTGLGVTKSSDVTKHHCRLFLLELQGKRSPITVSDYYRCAKRFLNWQVSEDMLDKNPMLSIRPPRVPKKIIRPFTEEEINKMLILCSDNTLLDIRNRAIILTLLDTGLRLSELTGIKLIDIDIQRETIKVMGKGSKERVVRIGRSTQKAIMKYTLKRNNDSPYLWLGEEGRQLKPRAVQIMLLRLGKRAGFEEVRCSPHTFRHTFATKALLNGADVFEVQSILGHSTLEMTRRYASSLRSEKAVLSHKKFSPVDNMKL